MFRGDIDPLTVPAIRTLCVQPSDVKRLWNETIEACRSKDDLGPPLSDLGNIKRRKYRPRNLFPELGEAVGAALTICRRARPVLWAKLEGHLRQLTFFSSKTIERCRAIASEFSVFLKRTREMFDPEWRDMVNMETAFGPCNLKPNEEELNAELEQWAFIPNPDYCVPADEFLSIFRRVLANHWLPGPVRTMDEYAGSFSWARASASNGPRLHLRGRPVKPSKIATAFALTPEEVKMNLVLAKAQDNRSFDKIETTKFRRVVNGDFVSYIQLDYMGEMIERGFDHSFSTLFMSNAEKDRAFNDLAHLQGATCIPLDWSGFDHQPPRWAIIMMVKELADRWVLAGGCPQVADAAIYGFEHATLDGREWKNGILSGLRWTALLDTLFAYTTYRVVLDRLDNLGCHIVPLTALFQGDDAHIAVSDLPAAAAIVLMYARLGVRMNYKKFFIARGLTEFLRLTCDYTGVRGYVWRAVGSLLWQKPWQEYLLDGENRVKAMVNQWYTVARRGLWDIRDMCIDDINRMTHISRRTVSEYLETHGTLGGGGVGYSLSGVKVTGGALTAEPADLSSTWMGRTFPSVTRALEKTYAMSLSFSRRVSSSILVRSVTGVEARTALATHAVVPCSFDRDLPVPIATAAADARAEEYLTPLAKTYLNDLRKRASRGVLDMWWSNRFPTPAVSIAATSPEHASALADLMGYRSDAALGCSRPRKNTFVADALKWSNRLFRILQLEDRRFTG